MYTINWILDVNVKNGDERMRGNVYLWLIHVDLWQKPTQYCKSIILQLKINFKK